MKTTEQFEAQFAALAELRKPFPEHQVSVLDKGRAGKLSYVGHAAITARLLDVDPLWTWEPMGTTAEGLPLLDADGGLWIRLTVNGMTRIGYGHAPGSKAPGDRTKELIGDALRNAAMRFGAALDLWHKGGDLSGSEDIERDAIQNESAKAEVRTKMAAAETAGAQARFSEICAMFRGAKTEAEVKEIEAIVKQEWDDLKDLPGGREGIAGARNAALQRVK